MGSKWWGYSHTRLAAGDGFPPLPLGRLQRGHSLVCPGARLADASASRRELCRLVLKLRVEEDLRPGTPLRRSFVCPPVLSPMDRLSGDPGRLHAGKGY